MYHKKKQPNDARLNTIINQAIIEIDGFEDLFNCFKRNLSILGRSEHTFNNYVRHAAAISLHFNELATELEHDQVPDYLYMLQQKSKTPSQTYFKHTEHGLRSLIKSEGLPYSHLQLPQIKQEKKLPVVLSKQEIWRMLNACALLKHRVLIGLMYGCGLRCMEARNVGIQDIDYDRKQLRIVRGKTLWWT